MHNPHAHAPLHTPLHIHTSTPAHTHLHGQRQAVARDLCVVAAAGHGGGGVEVAAAAHGADGVALGVLHRGRAGQGGGCGCEWAVGQGVGESGARQHQMYGSRAAKNSCTEAGAASRMMGTQEEFVKFFYWKQI